MSHVRNPTQRTFFEVDQLLPLLPEDDPYCGSFLFFSQTILPQLEKYRQDLEKMYNPNLGRPSVDPVRMLGLTMLQYIEGVPDRQAESNCKCDLRYKLALDLSLDKGLCDYSSLSRFRKNFSEAGLVDIGFSAVLKAMDEAGYLHGKTKTQRTDSTHVLGVVKVMSDLECAREALRLALEALDKQVTGKRPELWDVLWERYIENKPDYRMDKSGLKRRYRQAGEDAFRLLTWYDSLGWPEVNKPKAVKLLQRFLQERFEVDSDGTVEEVKKLPSGTMRNPHEPDAQRRTKDSDKRKRWDGSLVQVSETVRTSPVKKASQLPTLSLPCCHNPPVLRTTILYHWSRKTANPMGSSNRTLSMSTQVT
jgi:transposase